MTDPLGVATRVDAHDHFWDLSSGRYDWPTEAEGPIFPSVGPADLAPELRAGGIDRTVLVQTSDSTDGGLRTAQGKPIGEVEVVSLLGSFVRSRSAQEDPVHALIGRFRAGDGAAFAEVLRAGLAALDSDETPHGPQIAALVVPGHDGTRQVGLVRLIAGLAVAAGWTVADPGQLIRHTSVGEAKRRQPRDPADELASLRAAPTTLPAGIETILLVDDVLASGGTIRACVAALRRDGWAGGVAALVLARAR